MPGKDHPIAPYNLNNRITKLPATPSITTDNYQPQPSVSAYKPPQPVMSDPFAAHPTARPMQSVMTPAAPKPPSQKTSSAAPTQYSMSSASTRPFSHSKTTYTPTARRAPAAPYPSTVSYSYPTTAPATVRMRPERPCFSLSNSTATHAAVSDACMEAYLKTVVPCYGNDIGGSPLFASYIFCCLVPASICKTACCVSAMPASCTLGCFKNPCNKKHWDKIQELKRDQMRGYDPTMGGGAIDCKPCERNCIDPCTPCFACCTTIDRTDASYYRCLPDVCRYS